MVSRSYSNLLDLASGDAPVPSFGRERKRFPRAATVAGILSDLDDEKSDLEDDAPSSVSLERMIIVGNQLPLRAHLMEGAPPSSVDDNVSLTSNQLDFETLMSELPPSFPQTMMEGVPPSSMDDDVNQLDLQAQEDNFNMSELPSSPAGQKTLVDNDVINDSIQQTPQLPEPSQTLRSPQFPPHNLQVSGDHNQGHVDQASVIPHLDNMQLENSVPRNFGKSTRSQMDDLQVRGFADLQHQRGLAKQKLRRQQVYASNPGPDSSLKSQNKGSNTQQEQRRKGIEMAGSNIERFGNHVEQTNNGRLQCKFCGNLFAKGTSISRIKFHLSGEKGRGVRICGQVPKQVQEAALLSMPGGGSTLKTMRQRRKRIDASEQEQNNVGVAQQQEPLLTGEFERAKDLDELKKLKGSKCRDMVDFLKSGWTLLLTNLILEITSAVFDQLGYALVGMVLAFVALLLSTAELIYMARKERMNLLPIFLRPSTPTLAPGKPVGTIVEYFGLLGAVWQCFYSTVEYAYARQKKDNPIKMSLLPFIFLLCVVISKLIKK